MPTNRRNVTAEDLKNEVLEKIKTYAEGDFVEANRIHELILAANPALCPRLWYGMPGYAKTKDSAVLCFFRKDALISFGFTESIQGKKINNLPAMFPSAWYIKNLDKQTEATISRLVSEFTQ